MARQAHAVRLPCALRAGRCSSRQIHGKTGKALRARQAAHVLYFPCQSMQALRTSRMELILMGALCVARDLMAPTPTCMQRQSLEVCATQVLAQQC